MPRRRPEYIDGNMDYGERFNPDPPSGRYRCVPAAELLREAQQDRRGALSPAAEGDAS